MEAAEATLSWSLDVECPHCHEDFDIAKIDYEMDNTFAHAIFNNKWDDVNGSEIDCPKCEKTFQISKMEY